MMRFVSTTGSLSVRSGATLGAVLVASAAGLALPTVLTLPAAAVDLRWTVAVLVLASLAGALALLLPWERWSPLTLLAWPAVVTGGLGLGGLLAPRGSLATLPGLMVLVFLYIGLTQRPWVSVPTLPFALICWAQGYGGWTEDVLLRLPIAVGVWLIVAETVSRLRSQVVQLTTSLRFQASTDVLTGLSTRRSLDEHLDLLAPGDAIVFIDLDHFKAINDRDGHAAGDLVLADMGATVRAVLRQEDPAVRFGGEELLLVLRRGGLDGAYATLRRLQDRWRALQPMVTFSAGIAVMEEGRDPNQVLQAADRAVYAAKAAGRNCWRLESSHPAPARSA